MMLEILGHSSDDKLSNTYLHSQLVESTLLVNEVNEMLDIAYSKFGLGTRKDNVVRIRAIQAYMYDSKNDKNGKVVTNDNINKIIVDVTEEQNVVFSDENDAVFMIDDEDL